MNPTRYFHSLRPAGFRNVCMGLLLLCAFPASAQTLHLVTEEWPGLINDTPQGPSGVLWEVSREVLENMGYELKLEFVPWKRAQRLVLGRIDAMLANRDVISIQAERLGVADRLSASEKSVSGGPVYLAYSPETPDGFLAAFSDALKHYKNSEDYAVGGLR